jgi:phosphoadenosine phosphosulfate reductase
VFRRVHGDCAGQWVLSPIWDWSTDDIWAYLAAHNIPPNPIYPRLETLGVPEVAHRVGLILSSDGIDRGRVAWLRAGWPDLANVVTSLLPRAREDT